MNWLEFISSIVGSLAWPLSFGVAALVFKGPLASLLKRMTEFELFGNKAVFSTELKRAELAAEALPPESEGPHPPPDEAFLTLVNLSPAAAVMEAFKKVEAVLNEWESAQGMTHTPTNETFVHWLWNGGSLSSTEFDLYKALARTRNIAVHSNSEKITAGEAISYNELCENLVVVLRRAIKHWESRG